MKRKKDAPETVETVDTAPEAEAQVDDELPDIEAEPEKTEQEAQIEALGEELAKQKELYLRLAAEYDNFRKRTVREKAAIADDVRGEAINSILPIIDNLERALGAASADGEAMRKGVEMVLTQTLSIFERMNVKAFGEVGDAFDPNFHNCVGTIETDEYESGTITLVMQRGYMLGERVIRPAMVQTAQ